MIFSASYMETKGQILAKLDKRTYKINVKGAEAGVGRAKVQLERRNSVKRHLVEGSGSFRPKPMIIAEWMIATESGCCLRPLGIVMDGTAQ